MEKLTKKQRHEIYKEIYNALINRVNGGININVGFCNAYCGLYHKSWADWESCPLESFIEYLLFKNDDENRYFFGISSIDGHEQRLTALELCIEMTK